MKKIIISRKNTSTTNHGIFEGWGSSLCWWANRIGYSDVLTRQAAELFYGDSGLALNIMRYNIGGGDDPSHHHIRRTDSAVPGWMKWDEKSKQFQYDYHADSNQLNVLKACYEQAGSDAYVEAFSNSAPYFMTVSGCSCGGENPDMNNLKPECFTDFAEYLAHVCAYLGDTLGIPVKSIAPMNEPNTDYWRAFSDKQEGCHFDVGASQSHMLVETKKAFQAAGLSSVILSASDETSTDRQLLACRSYSDDAWKVIDRISTHSYGIEKIEELGQYAKENHQNLWMSETDGCFLSGEDAGEMAAALGYAQKIITDINGLSPSAWVMWQLIDNHISKDGYDGNPDFGMPNLQYGYWGVAVADHDRRKIILTKKYYAMGQFTRYMRAGCQIIHCGEDSLASYDSKTGQLSILIINAEKTDVPCEIDIHEFERENVRVKMVRTSGDVETGENWKELEETESVSGKINVVLKKESITTYLVKCEK